jgi:hypothetical protein
VGKKFRKRCAKGLTDLFSAIYYSHKNEGTETKAFKLITLFKNLTAKDHSLGTLLDGYYYQNDRLISICPEL